LSSHTSGLLEPSKKKKIGLALSGLAVLSLLLASNALVAPAAYAFANGQNASTVIGQPNFTTGLGILPIVNASRLDAPYDVKFDSSGNMWVVDSADSRILEFTPPFTIDEKASVVIGEPNLSTTYPGGSLVTNGTVLYVPEAIAFDSSGNLWVSDTGEARILEYTQPFTTGENASLALGVPNLQTAGDTTTPASQTNLNTPVGLTFDSSGNLWVADGGYDRVEEFTAPFSNGEGAMIVLGQDNFTSKNFPNEPNCPPGCNTPTKATLDGPFDVAFDSSGNLWVADRNDHRISEFTPPFTNGEAANTIIGGFCAIFGEELAANCLSVTEFIGFDHSGMLWVSDLGDGRVLGFPAPITTGENATVVLGEPDFQTTYPINVNATQSNLESPEGFAFDSSGNLWVSDSGFNRVLEFSSSVVGTTTSSTTSAASTTHTSATQTQQTTTSLTAASSSAQSSSSSTQTSSSSGASVPEFPYQTLAVVAASVLIAASYLLIRRRP
jgi:sugar lactone lactonase YvrE